MIRRVIGSMSLAALLCIGTAAYAQEPPPGGEGGEGGGGGTAMAPASNGGGESSDAYKMGIETAFPTGGDGAHANFLWGMGKNMLDLGIGIDFVHTDVADPMTGDKTTFGVDLFAGYRMYKPMKGKLHPYLEPAIHFGIPSFSHAGDTMVLGVGAMFGVNYEIIPQFTLGTGIGAGLNFSNKFKDINFGLITASITAGFWWN
jgi:hypothetical protein